MVSYLEWWFMISNFVSVLGKTEDCLLEDTQINCKRVLPTNGSSPYVESVRLSDVDLTHLDFNVFLNLFPNVKNLSVIGNNRTVLGKMVLPHKNTKIKALQLNGLQISHFNEHFLDHFPDLEVLNISANFLTELPRLPFADIKEVYLAANRWNCSGHLEWLLELDHAVFRDLDKLICFKMPHNNKPVLAIARIQKETRQTCTANCSCWLLKCVTDPKTGLLEPIIEVNCSYRNFTELPKTFPLKTKILHLEGNQIEDLSPIRENLKYKLLSDLYLDDNNIHCINVLEGSTYLKHFRVFSLAGNRLTELPTYAIDNALQRNLNMPDAVRISLGRNPWRCDCLFTPAFQEMLQKYAPQITDLRDIKCGPAKGDPNSNKMVVDLTRVDVCHSPPEYSIQDALDLLNTILALLIIFILSKLAYDYYKFKKTGRLPWIITKMP
ncbi:protein singed wings 2 [Cylas formicarius]|uniref:protein singed wings 2 n=1 Tax=Cylas formicarius TaxID=197179 RepID=UPI0029585686|nr:protein singed wings 2 [Cylas formicarius]